MTNSWEGAPFVTDLEALGSLLGTFQEQIDMFGLQISGLGCRGSGFRVWELGIGYILGANNFCSRFLAQFIGSRLFFQTNQASSKYPQIQGFLKHDINGFSQETPFFEEALFPKLSCMKT